MRGFVIVLVLLAPGAAFGSAMAVRMESAPMADVHVVGPAEVDNVRIEVRCSARRWAEWSATCKTRATFDVIAGGSLTMTAMASVVDDVDLGAPGVARTLAAGERATVTVTSTRWLKTTTTWREPFILGPMIARHPYLGASKDLEHHAGIGEIALVSGGELTLTGAPVLDDRARGEVVVAVARAEASVDPDGVPRSHTLGSPDEGGPLRERRWTVTMTLPARDPVHGLLRAGGPVLALGIRDESFLVRGGWELGLGEHMFLSAALETDFSSILESVVIDVATPELLVLIPSLRVGTGVVARQLGDRDADAGVRLRAGANVFAIGTDVDFDYWPAIDGWTLSATGRFSL